MLYVYPTFDYELFLGGSDYSEYEVLIEPTDKLMRLFDSSGCKYTLFADTCSLLQYKINGLTDFPTMAEEQLKRVISSGNDVQLHIHPHWRKAVYANGEWHIDNKYYRLHAFSDIDNIIAENKNYLCGILREVDNSYRCIAFRAGGFCIQPEQEILKILKDNDIIDYPHYFDYRKLKRRTSWWFDAIQGISDRQTDSTLLEIPVATSGIGFSKVKLFLNKMSPVIPQNKGKYINEIETEKKNVIREMIKLVSRFLLDPYMCEFDCADYKRMIKIIKPYINECKNKNKAMAIIGHPKMSWEGWFYHMQCFLDVIMGEFYDSIKIVTMREAYDIINNEK